MNPTMMKDMSRVLSGLSMVARELVRRSEVEGSKDVIQSLVKTTASVCGFTRGRVHSHELANPNVAHESTSSSDDAESGGSVVYFDAVSRSDSASDFEEPSSSSSCSSPVPAHGEELVSTQEPAAIVSEAANYTESKSRNGRMVDGVDQLVSDTQTAAYTAAATTPVKRRMPRERKVPSTPFSRAMGLVPFILHN